jgi:hypothetical protein
MSALLLRTVFVFLWTGFGGSEEAWDARGFAHSAATGVCSAVKEEPAAPRVLENPHQVGVVLVQNSRERAELSKWKFELSYSPVQKAFSTLPATERRSAAL